MGAIVVAVAMHLGWPARHPSQKIAWSKDSHNSFLAGRIDHRKLHTAFLNVHDTLRRIALREDSFFCLKFADPSPQIGQSRNNFTSKAGAFECTFWGWWRTDTRLAVAFIMG